MNWLLYSCPRCVLSDLLPFSGTYLYLLHAFFNQKSEDDLRSPSQMYVEALQHSLKMPHCRLIPFFGSFLRDLFSVVNDLPSIVVIGNDGEGKYKDNLIWSDQTHIQYHTQWPISCIRTNFFILRRQVEVSHWHKWRWSFFIDNWS